MPEINQQLSKVSRILIITEAWPPAQNADGLRFASALAATGREPAIITNSQDTDGTDIDRQHFNLMRLPLEPPRKTGFLFGIRNALFFGTAANPGNYALLRDRLHMHLQEVLYDAVLILCPPQIYLRLGNWIHETFGIPVWLHLGTAMTRPDTGWNHRRLLRKYLAAASAITAPEAGILDGIAPHREQSVLVSGSTPGNDIHFSEPATGTSFSLEALLQRIIRKKQHS